MQKRLIDAKPLMGDGWHLVKTGKSNVFLASMSLADAPTVDAVEVVRCKDCRFTIDRENETHGCYRNFIEDCKPDDFCSYGERRTTYD